MSTKYVYVIHMDEYLVKKNGSRDLMYAGIKSEVYANEAAAMRRLAELADHIFGSMGSTMNGNVKTVYRVMRVPLNEEK